MIPVENFTSAEKQAFRAATGLDDLAASVQQLGEQVRESAEAFFDLETGPVTPSAPALLLKPDATENVVPAINAELSSRRRLHLSAHNGTAGIARYAMTEPVILPSNSHLSFDRGARLVGLDGTNPGKGISVEGAAPTSWVPISVDAVIGGNTATFATDPGWTVGDWIELRSEAVLPVVSNSLGNKCAVGRKITRKTGTAPVVYELHKPLPYSFLVADTARAGRCTMVENVVIDCAQINDEEGSAVFSFPIYLRYCANVTILNPRMFRSKAPYGADTTTGDFIKIMNAHDVEIHNPFGRHIGYYGLSIAGWSENIRSYGGAMDDVRHGVSIVFRDPAFAEPYGQPIGVLIHGLPVSQSTLSAFDSHDTGLDITYAYCTADGAGDDGFQVRSPFVMLDHCKAIRCFFDGFSFRNYAPDAAIPTRGTRATGCEAIENGRYGIECRDGDMTWIGGRVIGNGSANARGGAKSGGGPGFAVHSGLIQGAEIRDNGGTTAILHGLSGNGQGPLKVLGCDMPGSARQTSAIGTLAATGYDLSRAEMRDNNLSGYGNTLFQNSGTVKNVSPSTRGNRTVADGVAVKGRVTLDGGKATVLTTAVRNKAAANFGEAIVSEVSLRRISPAGVPGPVSVVQMVDQKSFTIKSANFAEPTRTNVIRNNTMQGAAAGAPGTLPTNWSVSSLAGLTREIVGVGVEVGPGGGTQNYVDIRYSGTTTAALNHTIYFDTASNPAATASSGEDWVSSYGAKIVAGSTTGISGFNTLLVSFTSGGAAVDNLFTAAAISTVGRRFDLPGRFTGATAFARGGLIMAAPSGSTIDITLRIYMPQLEKGPDASGPIPTSGTAVTRTLDSTATDNSVIEWEVSL